MDYLHPCEKWRIEFICSPCAVMIAAGVLIHLQLFHMLVFLISWHPCAPTGTGWITGEMTKRKSWFIAAGCSTSSQLLNIQVFMSGREKSVYWAEDAKMFLLVCRLDLWKKTNVGAWKLKEVWRQSELIQHVLSSAEGGKFGWFSSWQSTECCILGWWPNQCW